MWVRAFVEADVPSTHQLLHLPEFVARHGAAMITSTGPFETTHQTMKRVLETNARLASEVRALHRLKKVTAGYLQQWHCAISGSEHRPLDPVPTADDHVRCLGPVRSWGALRGA